MYVDQALPFVLRSAPKLFTAVADAIGWALVQVSAPYIIHYLDDLLFFVPPTNHYPDTCLSTVLVTASLLGVPVAKDKIEGPSTVVTFVRHLPDQITSAQHGMVGGLAGIRISSLCLVI